MHWKIVLTHKFLSLEPWTWVGSLSWWWWLLINATATTTVNSFAFFWARLTFTQLLRCCSQVQQRALVFVFTVKSVRICKSTALFHPKSRLYLVISHSGSTQDWLISWKIWKTWKIFIKTNFSKSNKNVIFSLVKIKECFLTWWKSNFWQGVFHQNTIFSMVKFTKI